MRRHLHAIVLVFLVVLGISTANAGLAVTCFHNDIAGSPMVATNAAGSVVWKASYKLYGDRVSDEFPTTNTNASNKIGYAGSAFDASTGLSYMGARYYDPVIGRFMGIDPVGFQEDNIHSFNRYAYANNNPYKFVDRDGRIALPLLLGIGVLATGGVINAFQPPEKQRALAARLQRALDSIFRSESAEAQSAGGAKGEPERAAGVIAPAPSVPGGLVGDQSSDSAGLTKNGKRHTSGPLTPANGGTGDASNDFGKLTGGNSQPAGGTYPPGTLIGPNGVVLRPGQNGSGSRIDIPGNGTKPPETLHY